MSSFLLIFLRGILVFSRIVIVATPIVGRVLVLGETHLKKVITCQNSKERTAQKHPSTASSLLLVINRHHYDNTNQWEWDRVEMGTLPHLEIYPILPTLILRAMWRYYYWGQVKEGRQQCMLFVVVVVVIHTKRTYLSQIQTNGSSVWNEEKSGSDNQWVGRWTFLKFISIRWGEKVIHSK